MTTPPRRHAAASDRDADRLGRERRRRRPGGPTIVAGWLLVVGIAVAVAPHPAGWLRALGLLAVVVALAEIVGGWARWRRSAARRPYAFGPTDADGRDAHLLATRAPELAAHVHDALGLLDGPIGAVLDADTVADARRAFATGTRRADALYGQEITLRAALAGLSDATTGPGGASGGAGSASADGSSGGAGSSGAPEMAQARADLVRIRHLREQADADLDGAATQLISSVAHAAWRDQRRQGRTDVSSRQQAVLAASSTPDLVVAVDSGARRDLHDALDEVRGRLDAIGEVAAISDRYAPDAGEQSP